MDIPIVTRETNSDGLTRKLQFTDLEASIDIKTPINSFIKVYYDEWFEKTTGEKYNLVSKSYTTKDVIAKDAVTKTFSAQPAVYRIITPAVTDDNGVVITPAVTEVIKAATAERTVTNSAAITGSTAFTNWFNQLGTPVIIPAINQHLGTL